MKHHTTTKLLLMLALAAAALWSAAPASAQEGPVTTSSTTGNTGLVGATARAALSTTAPAVEEDEVVRVDSQLSRVIVRVEEADPLRWEVSDNGRRQKDLILDGPDRPLQLVILVDLIAEREKKGEAVHYERLQRELDTLAGRLRLQSAPLVVVSSPREEPLPHNIKWPSSWETIYTDGLHSSLDQSISRLERGPGNVRRALLFLTNRADDLPPDTFEQTDARLAHSAALIYLMAVKPPQFGGGKHNKVIVRSNINGGEMVVRRDYNYVATLFRMFVASANEMHVVSYRLTTPDAVASSGRPDTRYVRVSASSATTGKLLAWNERRYVSNPAEGQTPAPAGDATMRAAIKAVVDNCGAAADKKRPCTPKALLRAHIELRAERQPPVSESDKPRFRQELTDKPELRGMKLYGPDSPEAKRVRSVIKPVLKLHDLERAVEVWVLDQDAPFIGLYREFILIVSTGELRILSEAELRGAAAHEFSHLFFIPEMRAADAAEDAPAHYLVEYQCDILAAVSSELIGDGPEWVIEAASRNEVWYQEEKRDDYEKSLHPTAPLRRECLRLFLSQRYKLGIRT
jgi:hypothetical protein